MVLRVSPGGALNHASVEPGRGTDVTSADGPAPGRAPPRARLIRKTRGPERADATAGTARRPGAARVDRMGEPGRADVPTRRPRTGSIGGGPYGSAGRGGTGKGGRNRMFAPHPFYAPVGG